MQERACVRSGAEACRVPPRCRGPRQGSGGSSAPGVVCVGLVGVPHAAPQPAPPLQAAPASLLSLARTGAELRSFAFCFASGFALLRIKIPRPGLGSCSGSWSEGSRRRLGKRVPRLVAPPRPPLVREGNPAGTRRGPALPPPGPRHRPGAAQPLRPSRPSRCWSLAAAVLAEPEQSLRCQPRGTVQL